MKEETYFQRTAGSSSPHRTRKNWKLAHSPTRDWCSARSPLHVVKKAQEAASTVSERFWNHRSSSLPTIRSTSLFRPRSLRSAFLITHRRFSRPNMNDYFNFRGLRCTPPECYRYYNQLWPSWQQTTFVLFNRLSTRGSKQVKMIINERKRANESSLFTIIYHETPTLPFVQSARSTIVHE